MKRKRKVLIESQALNASETETCACWPLRLRVLTCLLHAAMRTRQTRTHARRHECSRSPACRCTPTRPNALSHAHAPYALTCPLSTLPVVCKRCVQRGPAATRSAVQSRTDDHVPDCAAPTKCPSLECSRTSARGCGHSQRALMPPAGSGAPTGKSEAWRAVVIVHLAAVVVGSGAMRCGAHITRIGICAGDCWRGGRSASLRRGSAWNVFCPHPD